jgi:NTP pyrophosphatase (non-canonical NTP hydrolase)
MISNENKGGGEKPPFTFTVTLSGDMAQYGPDIRRFVDAMVYKLERNAHKGRWENLTLSNAFQLLLGEVQELQEEVNGDQNMVRTMLEAADVANFALMVAAIVMERGR